MRLPSTLAVCLAAAVTCTGQTPAATPAPELPQEPGLYAIFDTSMGQIVARLFEDKAPATVKNFVDISRGTKATMNKAGVKVQKPFYNGLTFHRVIKGFMIQAGDIRGTGTSACGVTLKDEIDPSLHFDMPGRLAMANTGRPNSADCQFFITVGRPTYLDGNYTIFGQVVAGQDVADKISQVPTANDKPMVPVVLKTVKISRKE
jgi:peptidyl-prolyl cis-trans isomerase A (cyclophilin A)